MKLRTKMWAIVLIAVAMLLAAIMAAGGRILFAGFDRVEEAEAREETLRMLAMVEQERETAERIARDYGEWSETIAYAAGELPDFPAENFGASTLANLERHLMLVFDAAGEPAGGVSVPPGGTEPRPAAADDFAAYAGEVAAILGDARCATRIAELKLVGGELWISASVPLTVPENTAGPRGVLVVGRRMDEAFIDSLEQIIQHPIALHVGADGVAEERQIGALRRIAGTAIRLDDSHDDRLATHSVLRSQDGTALGRLSLRLDRPIHRQARRTAWTITLQVLAAAAVLTVVFSFIMRRLVVGPLERMHRAVRTVSREGDLLARVPAAGDDEIADVGRAINAMLDGLARSRAEREEAHREREALQTQLLQAQKMEAIGEFAGGIAHDFNNCLTAITGWVSLVRHSLTPGSEYHEGLGLALASAQHASAVVSQLVAFSRQSSPTLACVSLGGLIKDSLTLLRAGLRRSIELRFVPAAEPDDVMADGTQVLQVVVNLVKNAADAMESHGSITISLGVEALPDPHWAGSAGLRPGRYVRLTVQDTGPGIEPALLERIFEPFFTTKPAGRGTGLGLAVVRSVALRHSGAAGVASTPGQGASFHLYLPHVAARATAPALTAPPAGCRVLIAEDDADVRQIVERMIARHGCIVETAADGLEAWEKYERTEPPFDIVLTDLTMPRLTGLQVGERIFNSGRGTPVLLMTAYAATLDPEQFRRAGFAALIAKPLDMDRLLQVMAETQRNRGPAALRAAQSTCAAATAQTDRPDR